MTRGSADTMSDTGKTAMRARKQLGNLDSRSVTQRERASSWHGTLGGFVLGAVVGVVIALLLAPRRGEETRSMMSMSTGDLRDRATGLVHQMRADPEPSPAQPWRSVASEPAIERTFGD